MKSLNTTVALALSVVGVQAFGVIAAPGLTGSMSYDEWDDLTASAFPGYGSYPGFTPWPAPMGSNAAGSGDAEFSKSFGSSGYAATGSMYTPEGGSFTVSDPTALAGIETVVFQFVMGLTPEGGPDLVVNGDQEVDLLGTVSGEEVFVGQQWTGEAFVDVYAATQLFQWDVSGLGVTAFAINMDLPAHAQVYAMRLDQSDVFTSLVPEPASLGLLVVGSLAFGRRRRWA